MAKPSAPSPAAATELEDTALGWRLRQPALEAMGHTESLGQTAENVGRECGIEREAQDRFALRSHRNAVAAAEGGEL